ncbi:glutamate--cysteine ligase [Pseudarthrobacter sulfonivorans]|uniref:glutamate--cysteine ligase n=1 Tax=Pseudarthrobacter sulfonivorans TaxID=121292 RepID=UPI002787BB99|nr:glutamate--cysteine ligase [Pseudarthrobacter sulfonivorans]MDQ0000661.1 carboxylate-amine ligase [Pseudarthrobacter sulfonivorans]
MRSFGVEEEFLLVDARTGAHAAIGESLIAGSAPEESTHVTGGLGSRSQVAPGNTLTTEVQREQVEAVSAPFAGLADLAAALRDGRAEADRQARVFGAKIAALGTSPLATSPHLVRSPRYRAMEERFGLPLREQLMCGYHVHVSVDSEEEGVAVLDRIRIWLPILIALSANSPFWQGQDTGYASFRYQVWRRWPTAGPTEIFGSAQAYHELVEMLLSCNVLLDGAMIYFDARLSATYPTVEIRVPDVCTDSTHAVAVAAIARALVETAARDWAAGKQPPAVPAEMLRLASWRASRFGIEDDLIHPELNRPHPAETCVKALLDHIRPVLTESGDRTLVEETVRQIMAEGTGARRQRTVMNSAGNFRRVLLDAAAHTTA